MQIGEWKLSMRCGSGKLTYANGAIYEGDWKNDAMWGIGTYTDPSIDMKYEGWGFRYLIEIETIIDFG